MKTIKLKWVTEKKDHGYDIKGTIHTSKTPFGDYIFIVADPTDRFLVADSVDGNKSRVLKKPWGIFRVDLDLKTFEDAVEACQKDFQAHIEKGFEYAKSELRSAEWDDKPFFSLKTPLGIFKIQHREEEFLPFYHFNDAVWVDLNKLPRLSFPSLEKAKNWYFDEFMRRLASSIDDEERSE